MNKRSGHKHKRAAKKAHKRTAKKAHKRSGHKRSGHKRSGHKRSGHKRAAKRTERKDKRVYRKGSKSKTMKGRKDFTTKKSSKVFNRRKHYQKHAKGSRVIRRPYHKKGGSAKSHLNPAHYSSDSKVTNVAASPKAPASHKALTSDASGATHTTHTLRDSASKPPANYIYPSTYVKENTDLEDGRRGDLSLTKAGVALLAKDLGVKNYTDKAINLSTLGKKGLAQDFNLTTAEVDAKGFAQKVFDDYTKIGNAGSGATTYDPHPFSYNKTKWSDPATNAPSDNLYIGSKEFIDWALGITVPKSAPRAKTWQG